MIKRLLFFSYRGKLENALSRVEFRMYLKILNGVLAIWEYVINRKRKALGTNKTLSYFSTFRKMFENYRVPYNYFNEVQTKFKIFFNWILSEF